MRLDDGFLFAVNSGFNYTLSVYDVRNPARPRQHRRYTAADLKTFSLAGNGTILMGGNQIHVLAFPGSE